MSAFVPGAPTGETETERGFTGVERLLGSDSARRLADSHVVIAGIGGVGSWAAEALARSGIGQLTLIDMDHVAESNLNRQVHALRSTVGASKIEVMAQRIADINPDCVVNRVDEFVTTRNVATIVPEFADAVIDAVDQAQVKAALVATCRGRSQRITVCGAAGGLTDPLAVERRDLAKTEADPLLARVRKILRREYSYPRGGFNRLGVSAIFSREIARGSLPEETVGGNDADDLPSSQLACAGYGSIVTVTAVMGMAAAADTIAVLEDNAGHSGAQCSPPDLKVSSGR